MTSSLIDVNGCADLARTELGSTANFYQSGIWKKNTQGWIKVGKPDISRTEVGRILKLYLNCT